VHKVRKRKINRGGWRSSWVGEGVNRNPAVGKTTKGYGKERTGMAQHQGKGKRGRAKTGNEKSKPLGTAISNFQGLQIWGAFYTKNMNVRTKKESCWSAEVRRGICARGAAGGTGQRRSRKGSLRI